MKIETIEVGPLQTNCYLVVESAGDRALIIDPGADGDRILSLAAQKHARIEQIFLTHGHWDHIGAAPLLAERTGAEVLIHELEAAYLADPLKNLSGLATGGPLDLQADVLLKDEQIVRVGDMEIKILHTPGHTPGSISLLIGTSLFCGDLIFHGSVGRTDLPGGNQDQLHHSVHSRLMTLADSIELFPGHGRRSTLGWERENNPFLVAGW